jgi:ABC-type multidrug transport system fused ATPase/permease subunit
VKRAADVQGALPALFRYLTYFPWQAGTLMVLQVAAAATEIAGVSMLIPLLDVVQGGTAVTERSGYVAWLAEGVGRLGFSFGLGAVLALSVLVGTMQLGVGLARDLMTGRLFLHLRERVQNDTFDALVDSSQQFYTTQKIGHMADVLQTQVNRTGDAVHALLKVMTDALLLLGYAVFLTFVSWPLTLLMLLIAAVKAALTSVFTRRARTLGLRAVEAGKEKNARLLESLHAMRLIKTFSRDEHEKARLKRLNRAEVHPKVQQRVNGSLHNFVEGLVAPVALCLIVYLSLRVWDLRGTLILVYLAALQRTLPLLLQVNRERVQLNADLPAVQAVVALGEAAHRSRMPDGRLRKTSFDDRLEFRDVSFAYGPERVVLHDISFTIRKGETVAVVGESGAGKSTLVHLILRLYDPTAGSVVVDGVDARELQMEAWHGVIGLVAQDTFVFNATVLENIRYGRLDATEAEVRVAADRAHATEFILQLEHGFDTVIGDRGVRLSGGERQRIAIARAFLRNPQILLMDEATSSLDSVTERLVDESMRELSRDRTTLIIAHRLATVQSADRILVMHQGRIVEEGDHETLMVKGSLYPRYHRLQFGRRSMEAGARHE